MIGAIWSTSERCYIMTEPHQSVKGTRSGVSLANLYTASVMAWNCKQSKAFQHCMIEWLHNYHQKWGSHLIISDNMCWQISDTTPIVFLKKWIKWSQHLGVCWQEDAWTTFLITRFCAGCTTLSMVRQGYQNRPFPGNTCLNLESNLWWKS